jgi:hypothetical protein
MIFGPLVGLRSGPKSGPNCGPDLVRCSLGGDLILLGPARVSTLVRLGPVWRSPVSPGGL